MDMCYIKKKPLIKNKAEAYYLNVYASEYSHYRHLFFSRQLSTFVKPGAIYGRKSNFILNFLLQGVRCLVYQIYQFQYLQSHKPGFYGYKMVK